MKWFSGLSNYPRYRVFDGKRYEIVESHRLKSDAIKAARKFRDKGRLARIVQVSYMGKHFRGLKYQQRWGVYVR